MVHRRDPWPSDPARELLTSAAQRARRSVGADSASVSVWDRAEGVLRTVVTVGLLSPGELATPVDEVYPVHSFPALVTLLERRTPYCFGLGDPVDVSSASLAARLGKETQGAAPITWRGEVWGALWVASVPGGRPLSATDIPAIVRAANEVARTLGEVEALSGG